MTPYIIELSNGKNVQIDEEELEIILNAISTKKAVVLKQAIIVNPNHIIDISVDKTRIEDAKLLHRTEIKPLGDNFAQLRNKLQKI